MLNKINIKSLVIRMIMLIIVVLPFAVTIIFSVPSADDFSMYTGQAHEGNIIINSFKLALNFWHTWGGGVPFFFIECITNPLSWFLPYGYGIGIELLIFFGFFLITLWIYIKTIVKTMLNCDEKAVFYIYLLLLFGMLNTDIYNEIFYWFVGSSYLFSLIFILWNQIFIVRFMESEFKYKNMISVALVGFIACFSYQLAVFSGIIYILEILKNDNYKSFKRWIPLPFMILGGSLSAFAPGNFTRHAVISETLGIKTALLFTLQNGIQLLIKVAANPFYWVLVVVFIVIGYEYVSSNNGRLALYVIGFMFSIFAILFPLALGYNSTDVPNRNIFLFNSTTYIWTMIIALQTGHELKSTTNEVVKEIVKRRTAFMLGAIVLCVLQWNSVDVGGQTYRYEKLPWVYTAANINNVRLESDYNKDIIRQTYLSEEDDVKIVYKENPVTGIICPVGIGGYTTDWINQALAYVAGKDSVVLVFE